MRYKKEFIAFCESINCYAYAQLGVDIIRSKEATDQELQGFILNGESSLEANLEKFLEWRRGILFQLAISKTKSNTKLTQSRLAEMAGLTKATITSIKYGQKMRPATLVAVCKALECTPEDLGY